MSKSTAAERAYARWYFEKNPNATRVLGSALRGVVQIIRDMNPRLRELLEEELAKEAEAEDEAEYLKVRTSDASTRFDVTAKTIREWAKAKKPPKRIRPSDCRGYVLVHPDDWKT